MAQQLLHPEDTHREAVTDFCLRMFIAASLTAKKRKNGNNLSSCTGVGHGHLPDRSSKKPSSHPLFLAHIQPTAKFCSFHLLPQEFDHFLPLLSGLCESMTSSEKPRYPPARHPLCWVPLLHAGVVPVLFHHTRHLCSDRFLTSVSPPDDESQEGGGLAVFFTIIPKAYNSAWHTQCFPMESEKECDSALKPYTQQIHTAKCS